MDKCKRSNNEIVVIVRYTRNATACSATEIDSNFIHLCLTDVIDKEHNEICTSIYKIRLRRLRMVIDEMAIYAVVFFLVAVPPPVYLEPHLTPRYSLQFCGNVSFVVKGRVAFHTQASHPEDRTS